MVNMNSFIDVVKLNNCSDVSQTRPMAQDANVRLPYDTLINPPDEACATWKPTKCIVDHRYRPNFWTILPNNWGSPWDELSPHSLYDKYALRIRVWRSLLSIRRRFIRAPSIPYRKIASVGNDSWWTLWWVKPRLTALRLRHRESVNKIHFLDKNELPPPDSCLANGFQFDRSFLLYAKMERNLEMKRRSWSGDLTKRLCKIQTSLFGLLHSSDRENWTQFFLDSRAMFI